MLTGLACIDFYCIYKFELAVEIFNSSFTITVVIMDFCVSTQY